MLSNQPFGIIQEAWIDMFGILSLQLMGFNQLSQLVFKQRCIGYVAQLTHCTCDQCLLTDIGSTLIHGFLI